MECLVLEHSSEVGCVGRQVPFNLFTEARVVCRSQVRVTLSWPIHLMSIGDVQQITQPAAPVVPALIADAVFQDHKVGAKGPQERVHFLWGPLRIYLINLLRPQRWPWLRHSEDSES